MPRHMLRTCLQAGRIEAGCDEAGRGPLAGPVAAAAVIVAWAVEMVSPEEIDRINILNASFAAMSRAVARLKVVPQMLLIDGNRFRTSLDIPYECIVKGDATFVSIAAASVLAKTYRDDYMNRIAEEYPVYNWKKNKGYPTREHREAVMRYGLSPYHRLSFSSHFAQPDLFGDREQATKPGRTAGRLSDEWTRETAIRRKTGKAKTSKPRKNTSRTDLTSIQDGLRTSASKKIAEYLLTKGYSASYICSGNGTVADDPILRRFPITLPSYPHFRHGSPDIPFVQKRSYEHFVRGLLHNRA